MLNIYQQTILVLRKLIFAIIFTQKAFLEYYAERSWHGGEGVAAAREGVSLMLNGKGELPCHSHK